jgi:hypothetical protein
MRSYVLLIVIGKTSAFLGSSITCKAVYFHPEDIMDDAAVIVTSDHIHTVLFVDCRIVVCDSSICRRPLPIHCCSAQLVQFSFLVSYF